jgi:2-oxoisovalerate dehydrogenase E2 component (dihydrolipoyl transacylase)
MSTYDFKLPDLAEGTTEGEIAAWHVSVGQSIEEDQPLVAVMTEKAVIDIPSPVKGTVVSLNGAIGDKVPVGCVLVVVQTQDHASAAVATASDSSLVSAAEERIALAQVSAGTPNAIATSIAEASDSGSALSFLRPTASPSVRRRAQEAGVSLADISGSGPDGRVLHADIDEALGRTIDAPQPAYAKPILADNADTVEEIQIVGVRRKIAERMSQSKRSIPHFTYIEEIDVTDLEALRQHLNSEGGAGQLKLTPLPFIMRALAKVLPSYPDINATFDDDARVLRRHSAIHIGIATQTPNGLMVPVVRHVEARNLWDCAAELARVTTAARAGAAMRFELTGSTITLTSLGPLSGVAATPIINHPEVTIIGPNRIIERPVVRAGQIAIRKMMNLSSSFDHRLIDGYVAAEFIQRIKALLQLPATLFPESEVANASGEPQQGGIADGTP